jgi:hypothetical protein
LTVSPQGWQVCKSFVTFAVTVKEGDVKGAVTHCVVCPASTFWLRQFAGCGGEKAHRLRSSCLEPLRHCRSRRLYSAPVEILLLCKFTGGTISKKKRTNGLCNCPAEIALICADKSCHWCPSYRESYHIIWGGSMSAVRRRVI